MTDEATNPVPDQKAPTTEVPAPDLGAASPGSTPEPASAGPTANEAWNGVVAAIGDLGDAVAAWARAATDDPENRRHLDEVRASVNDMARKADTTFAGVANSDFGQQVRQGAGEAGQTIADTAQKVSDAAAPHVANAFAGLADVFGRAAQRAGEAAAPRATPQPPAEPEPPAQPMPPSTPDDAAE